MTNSASRVVFGVDPGATTGLALVSMKVNHAPFLVRSLAVAVDPWDCESALDFAQTFQAWAVEADEIAVETLSTFRAGSMVTPSQMKPGAVSALCYLVAAGLETPIRQHHPKTVRRTVAGNGSAGDREMRSALKSILNVEGRLVMTAHEMDAVAVALYAGRL